METPPFIFGLTRILTRLAMFDGVSPQRTSLQRPIQTDHALLQNSQRDEAPTPDQHRFRVLKARTLRKIEGPNTEGHWHILKNHHVS